MNNKIIAKGISIKLYNEDYISLTDIAKYKNPYDQDM